MEPLGVQAGGRGRAQILAPVLAPAVRNELTFERAGPVAQPVFLLTFTACSIIVMAAIISRATEKQSASQGWRFAYGQLHHDRGGLPGAERVRDADDFYFYDHLELLWWKGKGP